MNNIVQFTNQILCGDNVSILRQFPDESIDLTVTSPPYDNLRIYKGYSFDFESVANELYRVTKRGGVCVWIVADSTRNGCESLTSAKQAIYFVETCGFNLHDTMIYRKQNYTPLTHNRYEQEWEYMFCFSKGKPKSFSPIMIPCKYAGQKTWSQPNMYKDNSGNLTRVKQTTIKDTKIKGNIFEYLVGSTQTGKIKHPAPFPEKLAEDQILSWSNENDIVLDPFCGSGTTCKMAKLTNRQYIGIDISHEYCEIARQRIASA